jgi:hypothetical protein
MSVYIDGNTLRAIAEECGRREVCRWVVGNGYVEASKETLHIVSEGSFVIKVRRVAHSDYRLIDYPVDCGAPAEADLLAFCKKVIQHVRKEGRPHKEHHPHKKP